MQKVFYVLLFILCSCGSQGIPGKNGTNGSNGIPGPQGPNGISLPAYVWFDSANNIMPMPTSQYPELAPMSFVDQNGVMWGLIPPSPEDQNITSIPLINECETVINGIPANNAFSYFLSNNCSGDSFAAYGTLIPFTSYTGSCVYGNYNDNTGYILPINPNYINIAVNSVSTTVNGINCNKEETAFNIYAIDVNQLIVETAPPVPGDPPYHQVWVE